MNRESLHTLISASPALARHREYLLGIARPCVNIRFSDAAPDPDASRFGRHPFVPEHFAWPEHAIGEYRFLGQIDFAEIASPPAMLPASGLLSLFYAEDDEGEVFWGDDAYVIARYWSDTSGHRLLRTRGNRTPKPRGLTFDTSLALPRHRELREDWPLEDTAMDYLFHEFPQRMGAIDDTLMGYPSFHTLAYDPHPGPGWLPLLTVRSHEDFGWCWHDGDMLMTFIEADRLARRNFGEIKADAG